MKKILAVLCSAVLTVAMTVTAFAQPSVVASGVVTGINKAVDADGNTIGEIKIDPIESRFDNLTDEQKKEVETIKTLDKLKEVLGDKYQDGMSVVDLKDVYLYGDADVKFPITITFDVLGVTSSSKVEVLHYDTTASKWEVLESSVGEGTITATFNSLSPVAFVVDNQTAAAIDKANAGTTTGSNTSTVSPKTVPIRIDPYRIMLLQGIIPPYTLQFHSVYCCIIQNLNILLDLCINILTFCFH